MAETAQAMQLGDVVSFRTGKPIKPGGAGRFPAYGSNGVIGACDEFLFENGVIIGRVGAYCGSVAYCPVKFWASDNTLVAHPATDQFDTRFLFYLLHYAKLSRYAGGAAQPLVTQGVLKKVKVRVPPLAVQQRIARVLSAYDDLVENSLRRIEMLDATATSLYREWFVNLRFPLQEELRSGPREGENPIRDGLSSTVGVLPKNWNVRRVKDILARRPPGIVYRESDVKPMGATPVIDQSVNEVLGFHDQEPDHLASPENPIAIFGDHTCKMQLLTEPFSVGPNVVPFVAADGLPSGYVFYLVRSLVETQEYKRHWIPLNAKHVTVADLETAKRFASLIEPMLVAQEGLKKTIRNLQQTRDLLLPRLLSGQLELASN